MKRKRKLLLLFAVSLLVLCGWAQKKVELLNDSKLIDLNAAIGNCLLGSEEMAPSEGNAGGSPVPTKAPTPTVKPTETPAPTVTAAPTGTPRPKPRSVVISVRGREVTCDSTTWEDLDALKERIVREADSPVTFRLVDDFAEAHVYRQIIAILEELKEEYGISYLRD